MNIAVHYADQKVGAVAGEKRVHSEERADAGTAGEGFYWKYESKLKKWDSELYSVVGAAGELFSVRTELYQAVPEDTILDDFMISMLIALKGFRIIYEPRAYAVENASANITEELKRKIRIAAGGIQSILRLTPLLNVFNYGILSFQYISHRVLRWTITPFLLLLVLILNILISLQSDLILYNLLLAAQSIFYLLAFIGMVFEKSELRFKLFFIPYYFCVMNFAILAGIKRFMGSQQSAVWEKAKRKA
jgi:cellulose synthase/poly-beta-1,6-N-acetylglucosamine synthase-like glycosyltransferase